ncbi:hypothetical protein [Ramlibacter pallidus]|uniref:Uncharacterized protein n=1 Tax=Ramlibacter pallidus TaxID=2780087 RepID=A0ABR9RYF0_9BURK|nr:hypothetical protein [Ramlibacter pallidus]MBE7366250.1 hypothetical protein [Ramlibacter pallidus]
MKKFTQAAGLAAVLALAAGGALAQSGSAAGAASGASAGAAAGAAGTTGVTTGSTAGATTTANRIAPADGSNALQQPGGMGTQGSMPVVQTHIHGASVVQAHQSTRVDGNSTITTTQYWANVPANVHTDDRFQRWQRLK